MRYWVVIPAAGAGLRFGGTIPKQHWPLGGSTVLEISLRPFIADPRCVAVALVLDEMGLSDAVLRARLPARVLVVAGGAERPDSVLRGLAALAESTGADRPAAPADADWVLVHDAARPCLSARDLERLLAAGAAHAHGALLAAPVADTLKSAGADGCAETTVARASLWRALTPQMFRFAALHDALHAARAAGRSPTDEAQALEWRGVRPLLVAGADGNLKLTTRADLAVAEAILAERGRGADQCA
ncbi:MAG: 2-C-methyl-D-erythritol 4-phosphate cytidylyltransferase [Gammaproteobacteria bacterium]|nr:2-C-methyl-D-erythritol 4-phosphate cytidylyltransferase [Gammaproteobacteria bacterium]